MGFLGFLDFLDFLDLLVFLDSLDSLDFLDNLSTGWGGCAPFCAPLAHPASKNIEAALWCGLGMFSVQAQSAISAD